MTAVYKRELRSYFNSMIGYIFIAVVMVFIGIYFMIVNLNVGFPYFAGTLSSTLIIFVFAVPLLTMKSMAEERKARTDQMRQAVDQRIQGAIADIRRVTNLIREYDVAISTA